MKGFFNHTSRELGNNYLDAWEHQHIYKLKAMNNLMRQTIYVSTSKLELQEA